MKRRLAAILVADVVGYSSLMEADEEGTAARLAACRAVIDTQVAECEGRVFKAMGDAVLAEFASPVNAVRCAAGIRSGLALGEQGGENPLRMRFGLHLADVLVEGDDLIGDGVNVAARIQQNGEPDAIAVQTLLVDYKDGKKAQCENSMVNSKNCTVRSYFILAIRRPGIKRTKVVALDATSGLAVWRSPLLPGVDIQQVAMVDAPDGSQHLHVISNSAVIIAK